MSSSSTTVAPVEVAAPVPSRTRPTTPPLATDDVRVALGETARSGRIALTVTDLRFDNCAGDNAHEAGPGNTYAVVDVTLTNTDTDPAGDVAFYGGLTWALHDGAGKEYTASLVTCHDGDHDPLDPGRTVHARPAFEIAGDAAGLTFVYTSPADTNGADLIVDLGE